MKVFANIFVLLVAGLAPIWLSIESLIRDVYWLIFNDYICISTQYSKEILLFAFFLSIHQNYCRYHVMMIATQIAQIIISLSIDSLPPSNLLRVGNLSILALDVITIILLAIVFIHIYKMFADHKQKIRVLWNSITHKLYANIKRITK